MNKSILKEIIDINVRMNLLEKRLERLENQDIDWVQTLMNYSRRLYELEDAILKEDNNGK